MRKLLLLLPSLPFFGLQLNAQCTPVNCQSELTYPELGGVCDTLLADTYVNLPDYSDFESFLITAECFDAGLIDPSQSGTEIKITKIYNFSFSGMPNGINGTTNAPEYNGPSSGITQGCASITGTPTEIGVFNITIDFLADVSTCGFIPIPLTGNEVDYVLWLTVNPITTFEGLETDYCITDGNVPVTITGTSGGVLSGPGITGTTFSPAAAGVGAHEIKYVVSRQEGLAIAPATDSTVLIVNVYDAGTTFYQDADGDGFGDPNATIEACTPPTGYVNNGDDCDDSDPNLYPNAPGFDADCNPVSGVGIDELLSQSLVMFPNPSSGDVIINFGNYMINSIVVTDINGRIVKSIEVNAKNYEADFNDLTNGLYMLNVTSDKGMVQQKLIIQK